MGGIFFILLTLGVSSLFSSEIDHAVVSVYAIDTKTNRIIMDQNSQLSMTPSSCMKIVTTGAALEILGEDFRYKTYLESDGEIQKDRLVGNLYVRGGGDPCLGSSRVEGSLDWSELLDSWVEKLKQKGIRHIEGKIVTDASLWEQACAVPAWSWEDTGNYYGAGASALSFHENMYVLVLGPGKVGDPVAILRTEPPLQELTIHNELSTGQPKSGDRACIYGTEFSLHQWVRGTVPAGELEFSIKGAIPDSALFCKNALQKRLISRGVDVLENPYPLGKQRNTLHVVESPILGEILYHTNQNSINLYAEHMLKKVGEVVKQEGSTEAGSSAITQFWKEKGIDMEGFFMDDGSGLSRKNLITTKQLVQILSYMKSSASFPTFFHSLPSKAEGVRGKTGSMSQVKGYAGYVGDIAFAVLINHATTNSSMQNKIHEVITHLQEVSHDKGHQKKTYE